MTGRLVEFFFDPISPYAWLASERLEHIEKAGARIRCRPVLLAALLKAHGTLGPAEVPAKRAYTFRDVMREAERSGIPFRGAPEHPFNPLLALRAAVAVDDEAKRLVFVKAMLAAIWRHGRDPTDQAVLTDVLAACGLDAGTVLEKLSSEDIKRRLRENSDAAIEAGVFGVPTLRIGDQLFWGADRLDAAIWVLQGGQIDESMHDEVIARPGTAHRRR